MNTSLMVVTALITLLPACPLLDLEVDVPEVCVTYPNLRVPGSSTGDVAFTQVFTIEKLEQAKGLADQGATMQLVRAQLRATSGISNFQFVHHASVTIASADPTSTLPAFGAYDCDDCASSSASLDVASSSQVDPGPYLQSGSLTVTVDLAGQMPATDWTMDVEICMSGSADYQVNP